MECIYVVEAYASITSSDMHGMCLYNDSDDLMWAWEAYTPKTLRASIGFLGLCGVILPWQQEPSNM